MKRFEYMNVGLPYDEPSSAAMKRMNDLGAQGWQLVQIISVSIVDTSKAVKPRDMIVSAWFMREIGE